MSKKGNTNPVFYKTYFSLKEATDCNITTKTAYIIANERLKKNKEVGRSYTVFSSFKHFLRNRKKFPNCHEILVDHKNSKPNIAGRLVFDFDIKSSDKGTGSDDRVDVPENFKKQIEKVVFDVIDEYFNNLDTELIQFVWSTSQNPKKLSKHLTVKNLYFEDWLKMSRIFYKLFCKCWDKKYYWINSRKLIDAQIVRRNASLRMVGSKKINGYPLTFDDSEYNLVDSLIRINTKKYIQDEQIVTMDNINEGVVEKLYPQNSNGKQNISTRFVFDKQFSDKNIYKKAFEMFDKINPKIFHLRKVENNKIYLIRKRANKCIISGKIHDSENGFITVKKVNIDDSSINSSVIEQLKIKSESSDTSTNDILRYDIYFCCYRYCSQTKYLYIGSLIGDELKELISEKLAKMVKLKSLSKHVNSKKISHFKNEFEYI